MFELNLSKSISLFQTISYRKQVRQMLVYPDSATGFIQTHFYLPYQFHGDTNLNDNIILGLSPN
jgi:hypothetical protein